jgi:uncharacterized protein involved in exopolysaccharide biosynthesis
MRALNKLVPLFLLLLAAGVPGFGQTVEKEKALSSDIVSSIRSSPAFAEVLLRKTELRADLESFLADYTEQNPKILDARFELAALDKAIDRLFSVRPSELSKLTLALGKMLVRKAGLEADLLRLGRTYNDDHPEVKRLKRKIEIYETSIKEILG